MNISELEKNPPHNWCYDMKDQLKRHIYGRSEVCFAAGDAARDAIRSRADLARRQAFIRKSFLKAIGGLPAMDTALNARIVGAIPEDGFRIEKVIFESRPKTFVTSLLYVPDGIEKPRGAVLFLCGHHEQAKHCEEYQIVCRHFVKAGLVVLIQDPVGQGERMSYYEPGLGRTTVAWGTREHDYAGAQCLPLGQAIGRYFLHDAMRGLDYLRSRKEVDPNRIGVTGNSGGGTQSCLMMLGDPRLAAAVPATFVMNRQTYMHSGGAQDAEQIWPGLTALGLDHEDVLLSMCPKPVLVLAVKYDFFPIEGTRRTVDRCKRIWQLAGKPDQVGLAEDTSTHMYTPFLARSATAFFSRHLLGKEVAVESRGIKPLAPTRLWCTASGQVRMDQSGSRAVYEENFDVAGALRKARRSMPEKARRGRALKWLRAQVFRDRKPCAFNPRHFFREPVGDLVAEMAYWWAQEGLFNTGYLFREYRFEGKPLPVTLAVWDHGTSCLHPHLDWLRRECAGGRAVLVLDTSGVGGLEPNSLNACPVHELYGVIHKFNDDLLWLNDSLCALRAFDVLRAMEMLQAWPGVKPADLRVYAHGRHGVYAELAAALDSRLKKVEVAEGLASFDEFVSARHYETRNSRASLLPGILKYCDLPDLRRWRK